MRRGRRYSAGKSASREHQARDCDGPCSQPKAAVEPPMSRISSSAAHHTPIPHAKKKLLCIFVIVYLFIFIEKLTLFALMSTIHPRRSFWFSPRWGVTWTETRVWLRFVDLNRTLIGTFFREVHPASEMGGQNGQNGLFCQNDQNDPNGLVF